MRLRLFVIFLSAFALILSCAAPSGASVKAKGSVGKKAISKALGGAKVNFALMATASGTGEIFMLTRDAASKTRDLGWALYDPSSNKVLARGKCPFEHENKMVAVSPNPPQSITAMRKKKARPRRKSSPRMRKPLTPRKNRTIGTGVLL